MTDLDHLLKTQHHKPLRPLSTNFTNNVLYQITARTSPPNRWAIIKERIIMKFIRKPALIGFSALALITASGTAYAALNWFDTSVQTTSKDNIIMVTNKDCPSRISNSLLPGWKPKSNSETEYKIVKPELITPDDIKNSHLVYCERQAIDALSAHYFPAAYDFASYNNTMEKDGMYQPFSNYGTVESVSGSAVTVKDVHINNSPFPADHQTVTIQAQPETRVVDRGQPATLKDLKSGDQVYFTFQDTAPSGKLDKLALDTPGKPGSKVLLIAKTQYDYRLMDKFMTAGINNAYELVKTNDPNAGG
jgi:hypothetical protein